MLGGKGRSNAEESGENVMLTTDKSMSRDNTVREAGFNFKHQASLCIDRTK